MRAYLSLFQSFLMQPLFSFTEPLFFGYGFGADYDPILVPIKDISQSQSVIMGLSQLIDRSDYYNKSSYSVIIGINCQDRTGSLGVRGSIPLSSTKKFNGLKIFALPAFLFSHSIQKVTHLQNRLLISLDKNYRIGYYFEAFLEILMSIAVASDHAGIDLKERIIKLLEGMTIDTEDFGTDNKDPVDYPDYGIRVAEAVSAGKADKGILVCGTGIGMSIVANKFPRVRAALCYDAFTAKTSRLHNDSNILVLGERVLDYKLALDIVKIWLTTNFEGGRHLRRIEKIREIEEKLMK